MNLPIFRDLYRLNVALLKDVQNIPKIYRHTLGDRIVNTAFSALHQLQKAYDSAQPVKRLHEMSAFSTELDSITFPAWRRESIKAYGNAVVPQIPYLIFETIEEYEKQNLHQWSDNGIATKKILTL